MLIVYHHLFLSYQQSTEYEIVLGRKNVAVKLIITFDKKDCFHLMGLQDYIYYTTDEYSNAIVHAFQGFRAPFSGKIVHIFPEQSAAFN